MHQWKAHLSQQCDQTQELKVAQLSPKVAEKVAKAVFTL